MTTVELLIDFNDMPTPLGLFYAYCIELWSLWINIRIFFVCGCFFRVFFYMILSNTNNFLKDIFHL